MTGRVQEPRVGDAALRAFVEDSLGERVAAISRRRSAYTSSSPIENLDVRTRAGGALRLVFKNLAIAARVPAAHGVRPGFVDCPRRELEVYRRVLAGSGLGTAALVGVRSDARQGIAWLLIERVRSRALWQVGEVKSWCDAARWLARLHDAVHPDAVPSGASRLLLRVDAEYVDAWIRRAAAFAAAGADRGAARAIERLASRYDAVSRRLSAFPRAFLHGEFFASNVLVRRTGGGICPIDWEMASVGPRALDLAALTAGDWSAREVRAMVRAYRAESSRPEGVEELEDAVAWCRLHQAVQMLGWSDRWVRPRAHDRDWLGIAMRGARRLGVM